MSTGAVSTAALAKNQVSRRGIAVSDSLIIPVLYSLPMASTPGDGYYRLARVDSGEADRGGVDPARG